MRFNFARTKVGLQRCFTDSQKTHKLSNYGCPSVAGRRNHVKNMHELVKNISSLMIITKTQIKKVEGGCTEMFFSKFVHILDLISFSHKTGTAIIRKFVNFSGIGKISALRSHFSSRQIEQHIYLAFFVAKKRKIGMKMYI